MLLKSAIRLTGGWPLGWRVDRARFSGSKNVETLITDLFGPGAVAGIALGPRRANRKPILQVLGSDLEPKAVGKVGDTSLTSRLVETEAAALEQLSRLDLPGVRVPRLLSKRTWNGASVLFMTVLPLKHAETAVPTEARTRAMATLARSSGVREMPPGDSQYLRRLREAALTIGHEQIKSATVEALDSLMKSTATWQFGSWHGDWTDWNMAFLDSAVLLWDWERYAVGVPIGWDALHYQLRRKFLTSAVDVRVAQELLDEAPRLLAPFAIPAGQARDVACAYLVEMAIRYTTDGQREAGGRTAHVEDWVLPVLPRG